MATDDLWRQVDQDLYVVLGLTPQATDPDVRRAWRAAAKAAHPDYGGDAERFRAVHVAYLVLGDPEQRRRYDLARWPTARGTWQQDGPPRAEAVGERPSPRSERSERSELLWLFALAGLSAVVGSYLWPVLTIVTGVVVGSVVLFRYHRMGFGLLRRD